MSKELIRAAGGIVHADGNIFFTNQATLDAYVCAISQPVKQAYPTDAQPVQYLRDNACGGSNYNRVLNHAADVLEGKKL